MAELGRPERSRLEHREQQHYRSKERPWRSKSERLGQSCSKSEPELTCSKPEQPCNKSEPERHMEPERHTVLEQFGSSSS